MSLAYQQTTDVTVSVAQAIRLCNTVLSELPLSIEGEVANYTVSRGTFVFFDIKDETEEARLNCFMMLHNQTIPLEDGMRVVITGKPSIHSKSGKFSITAQRIEAKGEGSLKRAFELLKEKLFQEGLFATERKRLLPRFPQQIGIISSADAAGYGDFIRIAKSRLPGTQFTFINVAVQGKDAESEICFAFDYLNSHYTLDAIVLVRGGGSMEDLHAFNSEPVARAIVRSKVPVLVGVGHERDITIADFCADVRAATPSNAAQLLLPTLEEVRDLVIQLTQDGRRLVEQAITLQKEQVLHQIERMQSQLTFQLVHTRQRVEALRSTIDAVSPQQTLQRGYSITWKKDGTVVRSAKDVQKGDEVKTQLCTETIHSIIQ
jgi:exodeoxyribonuclease VII large subunit